MARFNNLSQNFTMIPNWLINNQSISLKAKGLFIFLASKPNDFDFSAERIASVNKEGLTSIRTCLKELELVGLLVRKKIKNENNKFIGIEYTLNEKPLYVFPVCGKSTDGNSDDGKPTDINKKDSNKKDLTNKEENKKLEFLDGFKEIWIDYLKYRNAKKVSKYAGIEYEQKAIDNLVKISKSNPHTAREILDQTIANNWTGLFELRQKKETPSAHKSSFDDDDQPRLKSAI